MRDNSSPLICSSEGILAGGEQEIEVESQMGNYILQSRWSKLIWSQLFCSVGLNSDPEQSMPIQQSASY